MRGAKPTPIEERMRNGNPSHREIPQPVLVSGRPLPGELDDPPEHLPTEAKEFWRSSIARLAEVGIVDMVDIPALEQLASQYARIRQAQRVIAVDGLFGRGSRGQLREHPAVKIEREATQTFLRIAEHFALTPVARTRLGLAELHRRSLQSEMAEGLGAPNLRPVESTAIEA